MIGVRVEVNSQSWPIIGYTRYGIPYEVLKTKLIGSTTLAFRQLSSLSWNPEQVIECHNVKSLLYVHAFRTCLLFVAGVGQHCLLTINNKLLIIQGCENLILGSHAAVFVGRSIAWRDKRRLYWNKVSHACIVTISNILTSLWYDLMSRSPPNVYLCNEQLLEEVSVIFTMMKVEVSVVS